MAGFVLTGGQSSRMGRDKALLPVGPETLGERIGDVLSLVSEEVLLVGYPERYRHLKYRCVADLRPGFGPLSGLETALSLDIAEFNVVISCDAYNVNEKWLQALVLEIERSGALCAVAQDAAGDLQPLCGVYRKECRVIVSKALGEGRLRAMDLLRELDALPVRVNGLVLNLNTPQQYDEIADANRGK